MSGLPPVHAGWVVLLALTCVGSVLGPRPGGAQERPGSAIRGTEGASFPGAKPPSLGVSALGRAGAAAGSPMEAPDPSLTAPLLSALLPGTGQLSLGRDRGWAYLALEALGWVVYADRRRSGGRYRDAYRDLAWVSARQRAGDRQDGDFAYYETLTRWPRSGGYDTDPGSPGVQPEPDPSTYNGSIWARARAVHGVPEVGADPLGPAYVAALQYYGARAYDGPLLWDWSGAPAEQERFAALIQSSDEGYRQATIALGLLFANHLVSATDAFVTARLPDLSVRPGSAGSWELGVRWGWGP